MIAERIKEIARENNIPIVEDKPLARAMYDKVDLGQPIPVEFSLLSLRFWRMFIDLKTEPRHKMKKNMLIDNRFRISLALQSQ